MNENQSDNALNINENEKRFEQVAAIARMSGLDADASVKALLQSYIDGQETLEEAVDRLKNMLVEAK